MVIKEIILKQRRKNKLPMFSFKGIKIYILFTSFLVEFYFFILILSSQQEMKVKVETNLSVVKKDFTGTAKEKKIV